MFRLRVLDLLSDFDLGDVWRIRNPMGELFSFHRGDQASHLDLLIISNHLIDKCAKVEILPSALSDHSFVMVELGASPSPRGPGLWRFDVTLLANADFTQQMTDLIQSILEQPPISDPVHLWDWIKYEIRKFTRSFEQRIRTQMRARSDKLNSDLVELMRKRDGGEGDLDERISSVCDNLAELELTRAQNTIFRAKCNWSQYREKAPNIF